MSAVITQVFYFLVFPGIAFSIALGFLLSWVDRKVTGLVQWRVGPPPAQPLWDILKLLGKEVIVPAEGWTCGFLGLPFIALSAACLAATLVWLPALGVTSPALGDLIVVLYLLSVPGLAVVLVGASREMKLLLAYDLPFVIAVLVAVFQRRPVGGELASASTLSLSGLLEFQTAAGSVLTRPSGVLAFLVAILCAHAKLGFVPFDVAEADCEIGEGALLEYSGAPLGLMKLTQQVLLAVMPVFLVVVVWGWLEPTRAGAVVFGLKVLLIVVLFVLIKNTSPRVRVDQALRFFWGPATVAALLALVLAGLGV
jgi:NADH-quinone oxidoreductase subunit H